MAATLPSASAPSGAIILRERFMRIAAVAAAPALAVALLAGCPARVAQPTDRPAEIDAGEQPDTSIEASPSGAIAVQYGPLIPGADAVRWSLFDPEGARVSSGTIPADAPLLIEGVPAGPQQYTLVMSQSSDAASCSGSVGPFLVFAGATDSLQINASCTGDVPVTCGCIFIGSLNPWCGEWSSLQESPEAGVAEVGQAITLTTTATGADAAALFYQWTASDVDGGSVGHFENRASADAGPTTNVTDFVCDAPGTTTALLVVYDGPPQPYFECPTALSTVEKTLRCVPGQDGEAGQPDDASDGAIVDEGGDAGSD
jgi:hypothetical protein